MSRFEVAVWGVLAGALALGYVFIEHGARLANDSYQYLNIATNIREGNGITTSLVHFATERMHGVVPAPATIFPFGYPAAITLLALVGIHVETGALVLSFVATCGMAWCLAAGARALGLSVFMTRLVLIGWVANSWTAFFAYSVLSESLFAFLTTAAIAMFLWSERRDVPARSALMAAILANICLGAALWVRYAGLFLLAAVAVYYVIKWIVLRAPTPRSHLAALAVGGAMVGGLLVRNILIAGTWQGRIEENAGMGIGGLAADFIRAAHDFLLGGPVPIRVGVLEIAMALGIVGAGGVFVAHWRTRDRSPDRRLISNGAGAWFMSVFVAVVAAGLLYLGVRHGIVDYRQIFPFLGPMLLLGAVLVTAARTTLPQPAVKWFDRGLMLAVTGYALINAQNYLRLVDWSEDYAAHPEAEARLATVTIDGEPLAEWLAGSLPPGGAILANDGQAVGYVLNMPTVSLDPPVFDTPLEQAHVAELMDTYQAPAVVLTLTDGSSEDFVPTPFEMDVRNGTLKNGMEIRASSPEVVILQRTGAYR